jgi:hypothetical protein
LTWAQQHWVGVVNTCLGSVRADRWRSPCRSRRLPARSWGSQCRQTAAGRGVLQHLRCPPHAITHMHGASYAGGMHWLAYAGIRQVSAGSGQSCAAACREARSCWSRWCTRVAPPRSALVRPAASACMSASRTKRRTGGAQRNEAQHRRRELHAAWSHSGGSPASQTVGRHRQGVLYWLVRLGRRAPRLLLVCRELASSPASCSHLFAVLLRYRGLVSAGPPGACGSGGSGLRAPVFGPHDSSQ